MLNFLWAGMILLGVAYGAATGRIEDVSNGFIEGGGEAVSLCITMLGIVSLWTGVMEIARKSGLIAGLKKKIAPLIKWLFPDVPPEHPASEYIAINLIANFCGLGWAATPAGLKAMEALAALQDERAGHHVTKASDAMCAFLVINISSIQLIPVNIIAYRAEYGSVNPAAIIIPGIIATTISTLAGVIFCKIKYKK
ncbi:MAG: nucleoside recognition domain-containing protein [Lachnospiraceae bacterium]|nr:nucleoside recognition domain-containing protein [Lachnospiraceae bacterium]